VIATNGEKMIGEKIAEAMQKVGDLTLRHRRLRRRPSRHNADFNPRALQNCGQTRKWKS
jgi:hypothetical protein